MSASSSASSGKLFSARLPLILYTFSLPPLSFLLIWYCFSIEYEPVERSSHSTARVGDYLYLWGGVQPELPDAHDNNKKKSMSSVVEIYHLPTSTWEQKTTTGNPPLGVKGYACAVIGKEIFYFGGYCNHDYCYHNSLHSLNIDTLNWREIFPSNNEHGPMMKSFCGMVSIEIDGEDYLAVIGGYGASSNSPKQLGAQYSSSGAGYQHCNEIHYYKLSSGQLVVRLSEINMQIEVHVSFIFISPKGIIIIIVVVGSVRNGHPIIVNIWLLQFCFPLHKWG